MNPAQLKADPKAFRASLMIEAGGETKRFGDVIETWQRADFEALDDAWCKVAGLPVEPKWQRAFLERPRGHSKTTDIAVQVTWVLFASPRALSGVVCAADRDQAKLIRDAIDRLVRMSPWLKQFVDVQAWSIKNPMTGSECTILSSDVASSYGLTPDFVVCDELTHWPKPDLWESLFSSAAKKPSCLLLIICNAGFQSSWQWLLRESIRQRDDWYFSRLNGPKASWITLKILAEQEDLLPAISFNRLWLNQWSEGAGDALAADDITAAFSLTGPMNGPEAGWSFVGGLDLAYRSDASALVVLGKNVGYVERKEIEQRRNPSIAMRAMQDLGVLDSPRKKYETTTHPGSGKYRLAYLRIWKPTAGRTIDLTDVEREVAEIAKRFRVQHIGCDPFQAIAMIQRLRSQGIPISEVTFSPANLQSMASEVLHAFTDRKIELFPDDDLRADLQSLRVIERAHGFRLESPRTKSGEAGSGHGDAATALGIALHVGKNLSCDSTALAGRSLVLYP